MKNIVVSDEYHAVDLKPSELLNRYIQLTAADVQEFLDHDRLLQDCACPGCGLSRSRDAFKKFGLSYRECEMCATLYVSPRPTDEVLNQYYTQAKSRMFWRDQLSRVTSQKRREKIIKPRFEWIVDTTKEYLPKAKTWVDINTSQYGYWEEMLKTKHFAKKILLNPHLNLDGWPGDPNVQVITKPWWQVKFDEPVDAVSIFEVADHTADVNALLSRIYAMLKPGGLCFITAILASGFDVQTLWDQSENLYPPDRLNVFSVDGLKVAIKKHHFECLEFSTPGILDVDIVAKAMREKSLADVPRFVRYLIEKSDEEAKGAFQEFLQANLLSSYGRIVIKKIVR